MADVRYRPTLALVHGAQMSVQIADDLGVPRVVAEILSTEVDALREELAVARDAAAAPLAFPHGWEDAVSDVLEDGVDGPEWPHVRDTLLVLLRGWIARTPAPTAGDPPAWDAPDVDPARWLRGATAAGNPLAPAILAVLDELEKLRIRAARTEGLELVHRQAIHLAVEANAVARNLGEMVRDRG